MKTLLLTMLLKVRQPILLLSALLTTQIHLSRAEIIPSSSRVDWVMGQTVGVPGGIPKRTTIYRTLSPGATAAQINSAITSCPSNQVVMLSAGTYNLSAPINFGLAKGVTLRGAGSSTILKASANIDQFVFMGGYTGWSAGTSITAGYTKGSSNLTVSSTSGLSVGGLVRVDQLNDSNFMWASSGSQRLLNQVTRITAIAGNVVTVWPPLYFGPTSAAAPLMKNNGGRSMVAEMSGVEDMTLDATGRVVGNGIWFDQTYGCWIRNVRTILINNYHIMLTQSLNDEIAKVFCDDSPAHDPNHGGVLLGSTSDGMGTCGTVFYDSIVNRVFPGVEINAGSSGNVIAYNFIKDPFYDNFGQGAGIDVNHSPHCMMTLVEGNVVNMIQNDGYFGSSSHHTYFRNWSHGLVTEGLGGQPGNYNSKCISLNRWSLYENIVGNVLGCQNFTPNYQSITLSDYGYSVSTIYQFGYPNMGNNDYTGTRPPSTDKVNARDLNVEATALIHGNWDSKSKAISWAASITDRQLPNSLYLSSKPAWFGNLLWPPVDPATGYTNLTSSSIPAGYRYVHGVDPPGASDEKPTAPSNLRVVAP